MTIPSYLERLIHAGKAEAHIYSGGYSNQNILALPNDNCWGVIYGYWYKPYMPYFGALVEPGSGLHPKIDFSSMVQWVQFTTGTKFWPFQHFCNQTYQNYDADYYGVIRNVGEPERKTRAIGNVDEQYRSCYIPFKYNVGIGFGVNNLIELSTNNETIPTNNLTTPNQLSAAGTTIDTVIDRFTDPFSTFVSIQQISTYSGFRTQNDLYVSLRENAATGVYIQPTNYFTTDCAETETVNYTLGSARMPYITVNYVQINTQPPKNIL